MSKLFLSLFLALLLAAVFLPAMAVAAAEPGGGVVKLENPLGSAPERVDIRLILGGIINKVMGVLGGLALLAFVAGGFMWLISAGNQELVKKGSKTMVWAAIGIFIIFSSYAILNLLFTGLETKGGPSTGLQLTPMEIAKTWCLTEDKKCVAGLSASGCQNSMFFNSEEECLFKLEGIKGQEQKKEQQSAAGKCYCKLFDSLNAPVPLDGVLPKVIPEIKEKSICLNSDDFYNSELGKFLKDCKWIE